MAFRTFCDNKDCRKEMEPVIDRESNEVFCTECGKPINTVSDFMKRQMVQLNQVRRDDRRKLAYSVKCPKCQKEGPPILDSEGKNLLCSYCKEPMTNLSKPFAEVIKSNLTRKAV